MKSILRAVALVSLPVCAFAQITTIQGSDTVSSSRTTINNNFNYLNTQLALKQAASIKLTQFAGLSCADGQIPKVSGGVWICGSDSTGSAGGSGDFTGPGSSTTGNIVSFSSNTGKIGADSGVSASAVGSHLTNTSNPHSTTAAQVGAVATGATYTDLSTASKIGAGSTQVAAGNHNHSLAALTDVNTLGRADQQCVKWDTATSKYVHGLCGSAGTGTTVKVDGSSIGTGAALNLSSTNQDVTWTCSAATDVNCTAVAAATIAKYANVQKGSVLGCSPTGASTTTYACGFSPTFAGPYTTGMVVNFKPDVTSTGTTPTVNIDTLGAKTLLKADGTAVTAGEFAAGQTYQMVYDGTGFRRMAGSSSSSSVSGRTVEYLGAINTGGGAASGLNMCSSAPLATVATNSNGIVNARLQFTADSQCVQSSFKMPASFTSLTVNTIWTHTSGSGNFQPSVKLICVADGEATDANITAASATSGTTTSAGAGLQNTTTLTLTSAASGCAGDVLYWQLSRASATATNPEVSRIVFNIQ